MSDPTAADTSPRPILRSRTTGRLTSQRRQNSADRINEILENARERAEMIGPDSLPRDPSTSPVLVTRPHSMPPLHEIPTYNDADETTSIVSLGSGQNYQTLQSTTTATASAPRPRRGRSTRSASTRFQVGPPSQVSFRGLGVDVPDVAPEVDLVPFEKSPSVWAKTLSRFRSIELENKGSVARDHLALERTFLAWLRTSLAFASIGVAVTQLFRLNTSLVDADSSINIINLRQMGRPLGATFISISILTLLMGYKRYFDAQAWVMKGKFPASRGTITITAILAFAVIVLSLVVVVVIHPREPPPSS